MTDTVVSEIVIVGARPSGWPPTGIPPGSIAFQDGYYGIWLFRPDGSINPDYPTTTTDPKIEWTIDPNTPESQRLITLVGNALVRLQRGIQVIPDAAQISLKSGTLWGAQAKGALLDITQYPIKVVYTGAIPGAIGTQHQAAVILETAPPPPHSQLYITPALLNTDSYGDPARFPNDTGINFVLLHEMAHVITPVQQQTNQAYLDYFQRTGQSTLAHYNDLDSKGEFIHPEPRRVEMYANDAAITLGNYLNIPVYMTPTYGH